MAVLAETQIEEFKFVNELPQKKTRKGLFSEIKRFFKDTDGGAVPVMLAAKMAKVDQSTIRAWIEKGKIRGYKFNKTVLVNIHDLEALLDEPRDKGGRPAKAP